MIKIIQREIDKLEDLSVNQIQIILSSLGAFSTTVVYLLCGIFFDRLLGNYKLANLIALGVAVAMGYLIQKGVFTFRKSEEQSKSKIHTLTKYLLSELVGVICHQLLFIQLLKLPLIIPVLMQNVLLRMTSSTIVFFFLFILRKYWVFI